MDKILCTLEIFGKIKLVATQRCFNAIHLAAASPCRCLACMPHCLKIFSPHQTLSSFCSLCLLIFLLLQHVRQAEPSHCCCLCSSLCFAVVATLLCCFVACLPLLLLLLCCLLCCLLAAVPLLASRQCWCFATCLLPPPVSRSRPCHSKPPLLVAKVERQRRPSNAPSPPHSSSSRASLLPSSSEPECCSATSVLHRATLIAAHRRPPLGLLLSRLMSFRQAPTSEAIFLERASSLR
jgi:hypothetical protein